MYILYNPATKINSMLYFKIRLKQVLPNGQEHPDDKACTTTIGYKDQSAQVYFKPDANDSYLDVCSRSYFH